MQDTLSKVVDLSLYAGNDPREIPNYGISEASLYLRIPVATLRSWVKGRPYKLKSGRREYFKPLIALPNENRPYLSFANLVEAHVLNAIRRNYNVKLYKVRKALDYLQQAFPSKHPLVDQTFETDGKDLFISSLGPLINASQYGQYAMKEVIEIYLQRIERDSSGFPRRLYPFVGNPDSQAPKLIMIDPFISFGRPVITGTGISTAVIHERREAGEEISELVEDYGRSRAEIKEAIRYESKQAA
jgi:uncharacterized protein (DUF433 family)